MTYTPARDFIGYGPKPVAADWPGGAKVALNIVVNYEEGAEYGLLEGDERPETILAEQAPSPPAFGQRDRNIESQYEFGSRVGVWRVLDVFRDRGLRPTFYVVGRALVLNPPVGVAIAELGSDVVCHGWRWIDYGSLAEEVEREHIARTVETLKRLTGVTPLGWYTGRPSLNTRRLVVEHGGFLFDSDDYNDDLPYWVEVAGRRHLVIPHSFDNNDSRLARGSGMETGAHFFAYMRDALDWLLGEGEAHARMMTVSFHCRLIGRPGRIGALARFLDYAMAQDRVWICGRTEIAQHWYRRHGG